MKIVSKKILLQSKLMCQVKPPRANHDAYLMRNFWARLINFLPESRAVSFLFLSFVALVYSILVFEVSYN
jgi:hypothetical protein